MVISGSPFLKSLLLSVKLIFLCYLYAGAQLSASFQVNKTGGCAPLAITFTNTTSGATAAAAYLWDFGNGNTSILQNPGAIYNEEKAYSVTLTVKDGALSSAKNIQITVYTPPLVDFTATPLKECLPAVVNLSATSATANTSYTWDYGDGNTERTFSGITSHTYTIPQNATVSLTVANSYGCTRTIQKDNLVKILPPIVINFAAAKTILCRITDAVQFSNTSTGPGTLSYLWNFGDGSTAVLAAPSHVFNKRGTYTVALTVTSSEGCVATSTLSGYINVADFTSDFTQPALICNSTDYISFSNSSTPVPDNYVWTLDGVDQSYTSGAFYTSFPGSGQHTIKLTNTFGTCKDSVSKIIDVKKSPDLQGFSSTVMGNCGAPVACNFNDTTAGNIKWEWNFQSQYYSDSVFSRLKNPSFTYESNGDSRVRLKVQNATGCTAVAEKIVSITPPYVYIQNQATNVACESVRLKLSAFISPVTDSILSYNWTFGDSTSSTAPEIDHTFSVPGSYPVTLTYKTLSGCTNTLQHQTIDVYPKPIANFTADSTTLCGTNQVIFTAETAPGNWSYEWDYGDGTSRGYYAAFNTNHIYNYDSTYTVRLIVTDRGNCSDTMIRVNYIKVLPPFPIIASVTNTCDGNRGLVTFTQASIKANQLTWDFGDGTTLVTDSTKKTVQHQYTVSKQYPIKLTATNAQCTVSAFSYAQALLKQSPLLTADKTEVCSEDKLVVKITNYDRNPLVDLISPNYAMAYEYGDKSPFSGIVKVDDYFYLWSNEFFGTLSNFDKAKNDLRVITTSVSFGCQDTSNYIKLVSKGSLAGFEKLSDNKCFKLPVLLKDTSKTNNKIISWQWNFGDGSSQTFSTGGIVSHIYADPGQYNISLTITDSTGCTTNTSTNAQYQVAEVNGPKAAFGVSSANTTITLPVYFNNNTNNYNSPATEYKWLFGDGTSSADYSPVHAYYNPGSYTVQLIAVNPSSGCSDTASQLIVVNNFVPAFSISNNYLTGAGCPPVLVNLSNNSYNYTSVKWDFGDGTSADNLNYPSHIYEQAGKYIITLYVYGPSGLTATFKDSINILLPNGSIKTSKKEGCIGFTPTLTAAAVNATAYLWDYGDGTVGGSNTNNTTHQYKEPGSYIPLLLLIDSIGCTAAAMLPDTINVHPNPVITIVPQNPRICLGQPASLVASGGTSYSWSPASGLSNAAIANPVANPVVTTNYLLTVKDNIGCTSTAGQTITVVQPGKISVSGNTAVCLGKSVQLIASGATSFKWIFSTGGLNETQTGTTLASPTSTTTYTVTGTDEFKCFSDTTTVIVTVLPLPTVNISPLPEILLGSQVSINSTSSSDVTAWSWSPSDYLNCTNCSNPKSTPLAEQTYLLTVTNNNGCTASASVKLKLQCDQSRVFIPGAFSPNGDGKNDVFSIMGMSVVKHMVIYNRWGTPVYERSNYTATDRFTGWNGTYNGEPLPGGTYAYFAEMQCPAGGLFLKKGTVVLVR